MAPARRQSIPLARTPTPYPERKPSLLDRLLGRKPSSSLAESHPNRASNMGASSSSSSSAGAQNGALDAARAPRPPRAIKFTRTLSWQPLPKLMRSPTPYPDQLPKRSPWASLMKALTGKDPDAEAAEEAKKSRALKKKLAKLRLARSPTPYPEQEKRKWFNRRKKTLSTSSTSTERPTIVVLRKEPLAVNRAPSTSGSSTSGGANGGAPATAVPSSKSPVPDAATVTEVDIAPATAAASSSTLVTKKQTITFPKPEPPSQSTPATVPVPNTTITITPASPSTELPQRITIVEPHTLQGKGLPPRASMNQVSDSGVELNSKRPIASSSSTSNVNI